MLAAVENDRYATTTPLPYTGEADHLLDLRDTLRRLISHCRDLATVMSQGPVYDKFRRELKRAEYLCSRVVFDRADGRWSRIPMVLGAVHQQAGDWLRGETIWSATGEFLGRKFPGRDKFTMLADMLGGLERHVTDLQTKRTGRLGAIIAKPLRHDRTQGRQVQVKPGERLTRGGLILPAGVAA